MKHTTLAIIIACMAFPAFAQEDTTQPVTAATQEVQQTVLLPVILFNKTETNNMTARLTNLQQAAIELGLQNLIIEGQAKVTPTGETTDYDITWANASVYDDEGRKYSTYISSPFTSAVAPPAGEDITQGDTFTAEGDPNELIAAWERLQELMKDPENATDEEDSGEPVEAAKDFGGDGTNAEDVPDYTGPEFTAVTDPVITTTTDGCNINVDLDQMVAIVQEKTLEDGVEVAACADTLTRYPIEKKYSTCSDYVDMDNLIVNRQYTLYYTNAATSEDVQVQDCTPDEDLATVITETSDGCSIRHDFDEGVSYQQTKFTYINNQGVNTTLQTCADSDTTYTHGETQDTCSPIVDTGNSLVSYQSRKRIIVNDAYQYITDCAPDGDTVAIQEEVCTSPRYTHDYDTGQSYLNKNYYYMDGMTRVDVVTCQQSEETFEHKQDESVCTATNDDTTKKTTMYARTYIEEEPGVKVYISSCEAVLPTIDYVSVGGKWRTAGTEYNVEVTGSNTGNTTIEGSGLISNYGWQYVAAYSNYMACSNGPWANVEGAHRVCITQNETLSSSSIPCIQAGLNPPWTIDNGARTLSTDDSDKEPNIGTLSTTGCGTFGYGTFTMCNPIACTQSVPLCDVTTLTKHPYYLRGDSSYFYDTSTLQATRYVCGTGSSLDGQIE
jgi:hypothetical protein